jgi:5'-AMP-activated protein kinase regulatory beta subunit
MGSSVSRDNNNSKLFSSQNESYYEYELKAKHLIQNTSNKNQSTNVQSETTENIKIQEPNDNTIKFKFEWKEGGSNVEMYGSFLDNWKKKEKMEKNPNTGFFEVYLDIPKGIHQFKFIVDQKWMCSSTYSTINDKNNTNNIIDTTNFTNNNITSEDTSNSNAKKKKKKNKDIDYNCIYPKASEVNSEAPGIPHHYISCFDINNQTKQEYLKSSFQNKLVFDRRKNIIENNIFKDIITISHDKISHICYNIGNENSDQDKFIRTAITHRIKHKFLTIIYYTPKSDK